MVIALACFACTGQSLHKAQHTSQEALDSDSLVDLEPLKPVKQIGSLHAAHAFATFLLAISNPRAGWLTAGQFGDLAVRGPTDTLVRPHAPLLRNAFAGSSSLQVLARSGDVSMSDNPSDAEAPQTVGEARNIFYKLYRGSFDPVVKNFIEEMLESLTIARQSPAFRYSAVLAVGFESLCKTVLQACRNDEESSIVRRALCMSLGLDPETIKDDAEKLRSLASESSEEQLLSSEYFEQVAAVKNFRYTYPFGAGLLALMPLVGQEATEETIQRWCTKLNFNKFNTEKVIKDRDLYQAGKFPNMVNLYGWSNSGLFDEAMPP